MKRLLLIICSIIFLVSSVYAFDGKREGFLLGFGAGYGYCSIEKVKSYNLEEDFRGLYTDFRIGAALTDQVAIHYSGKQVIGFSDDGWIILFPGVGFTYYHKPAAPSLMFMTGVGLFGGFGLGRVSGNEMGLLGSGINFYFGIGYEFVKNLMLEFNISFSSGKFIFDPDHKTQMISVSAHYLAY